MSRRLWYTVSFATTTSDHVFVFSPSVQAYVRTPDNSNRDISVNKHKGEVMKERIRLLQSYSTNARLKQSVVTK